MTERSWWQVLQPEIQKKRKTLIILVSGLLMMVLFCYLGDPRIFDSFFTVSKTITTQGLTVYSSADCVYNGDAYAYDLYRILYMFAVMVMCFFIIPIGIIVFVLKESPVQYGLRLPQRWKSLILVIAVLPIIAMSMYYTAMHNETIRKIYPYSKYILHHTGFVLIVYFIGYTAYYIAWEFFFRGYIQCGTEASVGVPIAIMLQVIPSSLIHLGNPVGMPKTFSETAMAIVVGIVWGIITWRSRSILFALIMHASIGILLDGYIIFHAGGV